MKKIVAAIGAASIALVGIGATPAIAATSALTAPLLVDVGGTGVQSMAATADGAHLFVGTTSADGVRIVDARTAAAAGSIALSDDARTLGVAPNGTLWVGQFDDGKLARITDPLGASPGIDYFPIGGDVAGVAFSPDGASVYTVTSATSGSSGSVVRVDAATGHVIDTSAVIANAPDGIAVTSDGSVWVGGNTPTVLPADLSSTSAMPGVSGWTGEPIVSPDGSLVYIGEDDDIVAIDVATRTVRGTIANAPADFDLCGASGTDPCGALGEQISQLAFTPDGTTLYETSYDYPWRARIDVSSALAGSSSVITVLPALVAPGSYPEDSDNWQYSNDLAVVGDALWSAAGGTSGYSGTAVERMPIAASVSSISPSAAAGDTVTITGSALVDATVDVGGTDVATTSTSWTRVTFAMPAFATSGSYAVTVSTPSTASIAAGMIAFTAAPVVVAPPGGASGTSSTTTTTASAASVAVFAKHTAKVSGTGRVGKKLTAKTSSWPKGTKLTYRWYANGKKIPHATKKTYVIAKKYAGKTLKVTVTAKKAGYRTVVLTSKSTKKVKPRH